jgi:hypothetical protein
MLQILLYRMIRLIPRVECVFAALVYFQLSQLYHTSQSCSKGRLQVQETDTRKKWSAGNVRSLSRPAYQMFTGGSSPRAFERLRVAASYSGRLVPRDVRRRVRWSTSPTGGRPSLRTAVRCRALVHRSCGTVFKEEGFTQRLESAYVSSLSI